VSGFIAPVVVAERRFGSGEVDKFADVNSRFSAGY